MVKCNLRFAPGSTQNDVGWMSSDAGIQLMVCSSTAGAPGPSQPLTFTTVAQVWVYFACLGVVCEPKTSTKYRSPGGATIEAACLTVMSAAGVGGFFANVAQPPAAAPHVKTSATNLYVRSMTNLAPRNILTIIRFNRRESHARPAR